MFGWCYGMSLSDFPPITKPNLITGEGRARVRGMDKVEVNHKKHLRKKTKMAKLSKRRNRV